MNIIISSIPAVVGGCSCHSHEHDHGHLGRKRLVRIGFAAAILVVANVIERTFNIPLWQLLLIYLVPYLVAGWSVLREAGENLLHGEVTDENFLMSVATLGALVIGFLPGMEHEMAEAVFVMLFFQVGELFEHTAQSRSRQSIERLMNLRPEMARVLRKGIEAEVDPQTVEVGETLVVKPGERIPLDGRIRQGASAIDTSALTGESLPVEVTVGDEVKAGCINTSSLLQLEVLRPLESSAVAKILQLVENASENKSQSESFIRRFSRKYTPAVMIAALITATVPPLFAQGSYWESFPVWLGRALTFLVVSCPCALVVSVPLAFFSGIGAASRRGILVKGGNFMEVLRRVRTVVLDKTGTLTRGQFQVTVVHPNAIDERELLTVAASAEWNSTHPIARSLCEAVGTIEPLPQVSEVTERAGYGVMARIDGRQVCVGTVRLMQDQGIAVIPCADSHDDATVVHVAIDGIYAGHIAVSDIVKEDASTAVVQMRNHGVHSVVMLTGDREGVATRVAQATGVDTYHAGMLPEDKFKAMTELLKNKADGEAIAFAGDGINDIASIALADVGIAMGGLGSDAAIQAADVVIVDDKPSKIAVAIDIAHRTVAIARQCVVLALGIKLAVLVLAAFGLANLWMAVFADVGVTVLAVLNAMRLLRH